MNNNSEENKIIYIHVGDGATTGGFFVIDRSNVKNINHLTEAEAAARTVPGVTFDDINLGNGDTRIQLNSGFERIGETGVIDSIIDPNCKYIIAGNSALVHTRISQFNLTQFNAIREANP
ncbi:hypothetical protein GGH94_005915 [Coemansia aciculifera]|uniref:Uncharacterized protein n=1 Tax=Coemansia aciculifera TaxID=417176 RepID=A0A9W8ICP3_9FUNG|nr:hypothetical protein GGH94_005915 [Coemansia aciculifera]KAJ2877038.1 hypothetical protein GGH93_000302 [Coemansia aciculifera]